MNYKKKYEDALKRAKKFIEENPLVQNLNTWIKETFPELKESELTWLTKYIEEEIYSLSMDIRDNEDRIKLKNLRKSLAWLEKQGNSPIKWNKNTKDCKPKVKHNVLMKTTHGIAEGEWQGEYWHQYRWAGIVRDTDVLSWMELSDLEKQGEQKPLGGLTDFDVIGEVVQRNLLEEVVKQMSDTLLVETLLYRKKQGTLSIFYDERKEELERFLKSICTWKPSDEQMKALENAIRYGEEEIIGILSLLYNDLKKL